MSTLPLGRIVAYGEKCRFRIRNDKSASSLQRLRGRIGYAMRVSGTDLPDARFGVASVEGHSRVGASPNSRGNPFGRHATAAHISEEYLHRQLHQPLVISRTGDAAKSLQVREIKLTRTAEIDRVGEIEGFPANL